ncbi:acyl carrier protein [Candidatus Omnitrophota bacterium]
MSDEVQAKVKEIIQTTIGVKPEEIQPEAKLYDSLSVDSTEMVEITVQFEKTFGVKFEKDQVTKFSSVNEIVDAITSKQGV